MWTLQRSWLPTHWESWRNINPTKICFSWISTLLKGKPPWFEKFKLFVSVGSQQKACQANKSMSGGNYSMSALPCWSAVGKTLCCVVGGGGGLRVHPYQDICAWQASTLGLACCSELWTVHCVVRMKGVESGINGQWLSSGWGALCKHTKVSCERKVVRDSGDALWQGPDYICLAMHPIITHDQNIREH